MKYNRFSNKRNKTKILIIAGVALALVAILLAVLLIPKASVDPDKESNDKAIREIRMSVLPTKTTYYVGEEFDSSGAKIQVVTGAQAYNYFVNASDLEFSGFDSSSAVEEQVITVTYQGFTTSFKVCIREYENGSGDAGDSGNAGTSGTPGTGNIQYIEICDMILTYSLYEWNWGPSAYGAYYKITYSDGTVYGSLEDTPVSRADFIEWHPMNEPGTTDVVVEFFDEATGTKIEITITVTITE